MFTDRMYQWAGVALLALACAPWRSLPANLLGLATVSYCAWQFANAVFFSPVYAAEGIYQPLMLLGAFFAFATLGRDRAVELFGAGVALASGLVLLGLLQHFFGASMLDLAVWRLPENPLRGAATFVTPNSFATAINMFLVPLAGLYFVGGSRRYLAIPLWLFAGLVATQSRGGMLAFLAGLAYVVVCVAPRQFGGKEGVCCIYSRGFLRFGSSWHLPACSSQPAWETPHRRLQPRRGLAAGWPSAPNSMLRRSA